VGSDRGPIAGKKSPIVHAQREVIIEKFCDFETFDAASGGEGQELEPKPKKTGFGTQKSKKKPGTGTGTLTGFHALTFETKKTIYRTVLKWDSSCYHNYYY